jgi:hypothetical protein
LPLWLFENEKAMGPIRSPMAFHPDISGLDLWVAFFKIKIEEVEVRHFLLVLPLCHYKTYSRSVVKENLRDLVIPQSWRDQCYCNL